jgi:hypothetical protein
MILSAAISLACFAAAAVLLLYVFSGLAGEKPLLVTRRHLPNVLEER